MRDVLGIAALVGALGFAAAGYSLMDSSGYEKLLALFMWLGSFGLLLVGLGALRDSRHPGVARAAKGLFWILVGLMVLLTLVERFGGA